MATGKQYKFSINTFYGRVKSIMIERKTRFDVPQVGHSFRQGGETHFSQMPCLRHLTNFNQE